MRDIRGVDRRFVYGGCVAAQAILWLWAVLGYDKLEPYNNWFGIPIWLISVFGFAITLVVGFQFDWIKNPRSETHYIFLIVVIVGCLLCTFLGIYLTEPREYGGSSRMDLAKQRDYRYEDSRAGHWYYYYFGRSAVTDTDSDDSTSIDLSSDDDDDSGDALAMLFLIALVIVLVLASVLVPHAWVLATAILCAVTILLTYRSIQPIKRHRWLY